MGLAVVIALVFGNMLATAGALSTGFIGGPIFPLFFVGGAAGTAINLISWHTVGPRCRLHDGRFDGSCSPSHAPPPDSSTEPNVDA